MKITYRQGCFETNSSSTHSMIIGMEDDFKKWEKGELLYNKYHKQGFCTEEEAIKVLKEEFWYKDIDFDTIKPEKLQEMLEDEGFISADWDWFNDDRLDHDYNEFVTPNGEKICMICRYGWDG